MVNKRYIIVLSYLCTYICSFSGAVRSELVEFAGLSSLNPFSARCPWSVHFSPIVYESFSKRLDVTPESESVYWSRKYPSLRETPRHFGINGFYSMLSDENVRLFQCNIILAEMYSI